MFIIFYTSVFLLKNKKTVRVIPNHTINYKDISLYAYMYISINKKTIMTYAIFLSITIIQQYYKKYIRKKTVTKYGKNEQNPYII